jgi:RNA 2',3'-cyclic 3'-phosphodiesterase
VRLFIAINFPEDLRSALHAAMAPLRLAAPEVRWVDAPRIHLTMKFLGEHPESAVAPLVSALEHIGVQYDPIPLELGGLNAFPNLRQPRVVWLGVRADPKLELLHHDVEHACAALGYPVEGRAFRPHVTLGRVRERAAHPARIAAAARGITHEASSTAEALDLMVSEHVSGAPAYRVVGSAPLDRE